VSQGPPGPVAALDDLPRTNRPRTVDDEARPADGRRLPQAKGAGLPPARRRTSVPRKARPQHSVKDPRRRPLKPHWIKSCRIQRQTRRSPKRSSLMTTAFRPPPYRRCPDSPTGVAPGNKPAGSLLTRGAQTGKPPFPTECIRDRRQQRRGRSKPFRFPRCDESGIPCAVRECPGWGADHRRQAGHGKVMSAFVHALGFLARIPLENRRIPLV